MTETPRRSWLKCPVFPQGGRAFKYSAFCLDCLPYMEDGAAAGAPNEIRRLDSSWPEKSPEMRNYPCPAVFL
ncbi:hypothetical protein EAJ17_00510 [Akkermansia sp. aa_0143]|nr:hypothetical protein EAJ17_00510 [Akkermansia sp. aa_0143]